MPKTGTSGGRAGARDRIDTTSFGAGGGGDPLDFGGRGDEAGVWGDREFAGWHSSLTDEERRALGIYQGAHFTTLNTVLRSGDPMTELEEAAVGALDRALGRGRMPQAVVAYRGVKDWRATFGADSLGSLVGTTLRDRAFGSATLDRRVASRISGTGDGAVIRIRLAKGARGGYLVSGMSDRKGLQREREVLLPRGTPMRVVGVGRAHGKTVIDVEVSS